MVQLIDTVAGHMFIALLFIGGAIALWWLNFPGPDYVPIGLWTVGIGITGRATNKVGDGK